MIAKMKYISIYSHISHMEHVIKTYLTRFNIQLEANTENGIMVPYEGVNPYENSLKKADDLLAIISPPPSIYLPMADADAVNTVENAHNLYQQQCLSTQNLHQQLNHIAGQIETLQNFNTPEFSDIDLASLGDLQHVHFKFGKLAKTNFMQYEKFISNDDAIIFVKANQTPEYTWGAYFTPMGNKNQADAIFHGLKFMEIPMDLTQGTIQGQLAQLDTESQGISQTITQQTKDVIIQEAGGENKLAIACEKVRKLHNLFNIKKYASITPGGEMFAFSGWVTADEAKTLQAEIAPDKLTMLSYSPNPHLAGTPVALKNPPIFKHFEFFTKLYGLPNHNEIDPTAILALIYTLLFGLMFGDVGHGLALVAMGYFIFKKWQAPLGKIIGTVGASATVFGFLYGSIFGFENILPALWLRPGTDITSTLVFAAGLGVFLVSVAILLRMYIAYKQGNFSQLLFSANGAAGLTFYGAIVFIALRITVWQLPITRPTLLIALLPLVFIAFKYPLEKLMAGEKFIIEGNIFGFLFNTAVELYETILTYVTNTISFVRVGAFAVSHAGMMHVVLQLAQGENGTNWLVIVLGNILVLTIEGLLVGIQALRLNFYEMFGRFYTGGGKEFVSSKIS